jgi:hypothetical protein
MTLKFSGGEILCADDGDGALELIAKQTDSLTGITFGSSWPTSKTPDHEIDRFLEKLTNFPISSYQVAGNERVLKRIPLVKWLENLSNQARSGILVSKRYHIEKNLDLVSIKRDGILIKNIDINKGLNKEYFKTAWNLLTQIKNHEDNLKEISGFDEEIRKIAAIKIPLEKALDSIIDLLK